MNGFVTVEEARTSYGVVINNHDELDLGATSLLRHALRQESAPRASFVFGRERLDYETRFPEELQDIVVRTVCRFPIPYRHFMKEELYKRIDGDGLSLAVLSDPTLIDGIIDGILAVINQTESYGAEI
jgi:hypothetical protein